jgi:hypothetical protein
MAWQMILIYGDHKDTTMKKEKQEEKGNNFTIGRLVDWSIGRYGDLSIYGFVGLRLYRKRTLEQSSDKTIEH